MNYQRKQRGADNKGFAKANQNRKLRDELKALDALNAAIRAGDRSAAIKASVRLTKLNGLDADAALIGRDIDRLLAEAQA